MSRHRVSTCPHSLPRFVALVLLLVMQAALAVPLGDALGAGLRERLRLPDAAERVLIAGSEAHASAALVRFYATRAHRPLWIDDDGTIHPLARAFVEHLASVGEEALPETRYRQDVLRSRLDAAKTPLELLELELLLSDAWLTLAGDRLHGLVGNPVAAAPYGVEQDPAVLLDAADRDANLVETLASLRRNDEAHRRLLNAWTLYGELATRPIPPRIPSGTALRLGDDDPRVPLLRQRLQFLGDLAEGDAASTRFDGAVDAAVLRFQERHGLEADGIFGRSSRAALNRSPEDRRAQVEVNLERARWFPPMAVGRGMEINLADGSVRLESADGVTRQLAARVGAACRDLPTGIAHAVRVDPEPAWEAAPGRETRERLEQARRDPAAFATAGYRIVRGRGDGVTEIDPAAGHGAQDAAVLRVRQEAGPESRFGTLRLLTDSPYGLEIHGAQPLAADTDERVVEEIAAGRGPGCIALPDPAPLRSELLGAQDADSALPGQSGPQVTLEPPLPVRVVYRTAWVDGEGIVQFRADRFGRDAELGARLRAVP